jgi:predicted NBD/HSP70 family sugar kinase
MKNEVINSVTVLSVGTGISAGVVTNGSLIRGANGLAGEIGHVVVDESGPVCRCGQRGCLEALAAGPAIGRAWPKDGQDAAATALFSAAANGDTAATKVAERITGYLTTALIWMAAAYDTEMTLLTGGVSMASPGILEMIQRHISTRAANSEIAARRLDPGQVKIADVFDLPGPRGAAVLAATDLYQRRVSPAKQVSNDK